MFEEKIIWHKVKTKPCIEDERGCDGKYVLDCVLPEDGYEILILTKYGVSMDACCTGGGCSYYLDSNTDWDDVIAWAYLPTGEVCAEE